MPEIRDTLPILLGVSSHDRFELESKLRVAQRDRRLNAKLLEQARSAIDTSHERAIGLYSEAKAVGAIAASETETDGDGIITALRSALY